MKILFICCILITIHYFAISLETEPIQIIMTDALALEGDTFDTVTHGKDIMFLFWNSSTHHDRMFKGSTWDMLATEKDKWSKSNNVTIAEMDCGLEKNNYFCTHFIAFNIRNLTYPYIGYSHNNERFKRYNESMDYPSLTSFLYEYFERNCALNAKWCTQEELRILGEFRNLTLSDQLKNHIHWNYETDKRAKEFQQWREELRSNFSKALTELQDWTDERDKMANVLLYEMTKSHPLENITTELSELKKIAHNEL